MFKLLTIRERLRIEQSKNKVLMLKNQTLEEAVLELAQIISDTKLEEQDGETVHE